MIQRIEACYRAVVDCWRLFKKYRAPQQAEAYWKELHDEAHEIYKLYKNSIFVKQLLFVMLDEIDRIWEQIRRPDHAEGD